MEFSIKIFFTCLMLRLWAAFVHFSLRFGTQWDFYDDIGQRKMPSCTNLFLFRISKVSCIVSCRFRCTFVKAGILSYDSLWKGHSMINCSNLFKI